jgi:GDP-4-dehydro-6-deoxy-D-mannose reductase
MKVLITGMTGFIGRYLASSLLKDGAEIVGTGLSEDEKTFLPAALRDIPVKRLDVRDREAVEEIVRSTRPDVVYHLAGQAYVLPSFRDPAGTYETNVLGTIYLFEALLRHRPDARVGVACSGAEYGWPKSLPIPENHPLEPVSPYGASKAAQDILAFEYWKAQGLRTYRLRLFGTTGPGKLGDAANDFATQIALIEADGGRGVMHVGELSTARDLSDVRDTVRAVRTVVDRGTPGEAINVGRGSPVKIREVLETLLALSRSKIEVRTAKERLRPADEPTLYADVTRLRALDFTPTYSLKETLRDLLTFWRSHPELIPKEAEAR